LRKERKGGKNKNEKGKRNGSKEKEPEMTSLHHTVAALSERVESLSVKSGGCSSKKKRR
jgi:hypothetical protein